MIYTEEHAVVQLASLFTNDEPIKKEVIFPHKSFFFFLNEVGAVEMDEALK